MKFSFRDRETQVLKAWGFVETNQDGDIRREEEDDFALEPGKWKFNGKNWAAISDEETNAN
jgi:hypothetical protein